MDTDNVSAESPRAVLAMCNYDPPVSNHWHQTCHGEKWNSVFEMKEGEVVLDKNKQYELFQKYQNGENKKFWSAFQPIKKKSKPKQVPIAECVLRGIGMNPHAAPIGVFARWTPEEELRQKHEEMPQCCLAAKKSGANVTINCENAIADPDLMRWFVKHDYLVLEILEKANYDLNTVKDLYHRGIKIMPDDFPEKFWPMIAEFAPYVIGFKFAYTLCVVVLGVSDPEIFPGVSNASVLQSAPCKDYIARLDTVRTAMFRAIENAVVANNDVHIVLECTYDQAKVQELLAKEVKSENLEKVLDSLYEQGGESFAGGYTLRVGTDSNEDTGSAPAPA